MGNDVGFVTCTPIPLVRYRNVMSRVGNSHNPMSHPILVVSDPPPLQSVVTPIAKPVVPLLKVKKVLKKVVTPIAKPVVPLLKVEKALKKVPPLLPTIGIEDPLKKIRVVLLLLDRYRWEFSRPSSPLL